ncbi:B3 domain-containing protein Os01g0723500-like [Impatiens glandulifera]|uniref:B3 domain-containing protein Os01g0723500-like n=1 Tax=Impatiens glandulifera TaxID=253017 RepID=UPI001FB0965C|nr:B3 domain-containing protein Os01g0723500-like [Impatiens glandulifera]
MSGLERMPLMGSCDSMSLSEELAVPAIPLKQVHPEGSNNNDNYHLYDEMLEKAGIKFPYILKRLTSYHVEKIFVMNFSKSSVLEQYLPSERENIVLLNAEGRSWEVSYIPKKNRSTLSGGWGRFAHENGLKVDDMCAFEILSQHEIRVHVLGDLV